MSMPEVDFHEATERAQFTDPPGSPHGTVASFDTYRDAKEAIGYLDDAGFPAKNFAILARGIRHIDQEKKGRWRLGSSAWYGMLSGAVVGALFGFAFGLVSLVEPLASGLVLALYGLTFGAVVGLLLSILGEAWARDRRESRSRGNLGVDRFDIRSEPELAYRARALLRRGRVSPLHSS